MNEEVEIWIENLIWCPSECYYYFISPEDNKKYCLYLRWRHSDPWTFEIVPCNDDWEFIYGIEWEFVDDLSCYSEKEYRKLEGKAIEYINKRFGLKKNQKFKNKVKIQKKEK